MPEAGALNRVNTPERLRQRVACNLLASVDFDRFVHDLLEPSGDDIALDIGPGLGKQLIPIAATVRRIVGLDSSPEMIAALGARISGPNVEVVGGSMDDLADLDLGGPFTLVYSVYSLYYSADPARVVEAVARLLEGPRARFVVVAPDLGNNLEWYSDLARIHDLPTDVLEVSRICRRVVLPAFLDVFRTVKRSLLRSELRFPTLEDLMRYYDACAPYCLAERRDEAQEHFRAKFEREGGYRISRRSLGLIGRR